jgi:hypothetical protein
MREAKDKIEMKEPNYYGHRMHCDVCGGQANKFEWIWEGLTQENTIIRACEQCILDCRTSVDERLEKQAQRINAAARKVRSLIGRVKLPDPAEWREQVRLVRAQVDPDGLTEPGDDLDRRIRMTIANLAGDEEIQF